MPASLKEVGSYAFGRQYPDHSSFDLYFDGTVEDWCGIKFQTGYSVNPMENAITFYMLGSNNQYKAVTEIVIPEGVSEIGSYQFHKYPTSISIVLHDGITTIGQYGVYTGDNSIYTTYANGRYLGTASNPYHVFCGVIDVNEPITLHSGVKALAYG